MANLSEDIQCASSDTQPPMLDRTDFASWQQRIRLYCQEGNEGALHLGPKRPRVYSDLSPENKERFDRIEDIVTMHGVRVQLVMGEHRTELGMLIQVKQGRLSATTATENRVALDEEQLLFIAGGQDNAINEDVDEQHVQDLSLNVDNVFQTDDYMFYDEAELEAEVDQNVVNRKHDEIERKKFLIANDNLIVDCLSKEVFYIATNSELTVSRFNEMHEAHAIVQTRCLEFEVELSKLRDKVQKDDHTELAKHFSNLEITQLTEKVIALQEQNELFRAENEKVKQHYKELYDSIKITRAKHIEQTTALLTENKNLKAQIHENLKCNTMESVKPRVLAPGRYAIDVEPIPPHNWNNREVHLYYLKHLKESVETLHEIVEEAKVERPLDRSTVFACRTLNTLKNSLNMRLTLVRKPLTNDIKSRLLPL
ncbi:hypothetical protein Tco_1337209 [Tanacetum coccineum]